MEKLLRSCKVAQKFCKPLNNRNNTNIISMDQNKHVNYFMGLATQGATGLRQHKIVTYSFGQIHWFWCTVFYGH